ncbi:MAG: oligosaccharide flippase family protein [archaeon]|jgi:O-antigen/teichoic acid export membrane protein
MSEAKTFAKNTFFNYLSKTVPAGASFLFTLIISNYLGPENYGIYNYLPAVLVGFATLLGGDFLNNLLWAFTARNKPKDLFRKVLIAEIFIIIAIFLAANLFGPSLMQLLGKNHQELLSIASIFVLLTPVNTIFMTLFKAFNRFGKVLKATLIENFTTLVFSAILIIVLKMGLEGAFIARFIAIATSLIFYYIQYKKLEFSKKKANPAEIKRFVSWNALASFVKEFTNQIQTIFLGVFINSYLIGLYYLGTKIVGLVLDSPVSAISEANFSKNSENYLKKDKISTQTSLTIKISIFATAALGIFLLVVSPFVLNLLFPDFIELYNYLPLFILYSLIQSQGPMIKIFDSINKTKNNLKINIVMLLLTLAIIIPLTFLFGLVGWLVSIIIATEIRYIVLLELLKKHGIKISVIPRAKDLRAILELAKKVI